jgi:squalene/oxidosqualene cyclase-like protein
MLPEGKFDASKINSQFDHEEEITPEQIAEIERLAKFLTNPNTGDDVYRKQVLPEGLFRPGSSTAAKASDAKTRTVMRDGKEVEVDMTQLTTEEFLLLVEESGALGAEFFKHIQTPDGSIASDYGGPMFLMPGAVITCYATGSHLPAATRLEMIKYILSHQRPDGGYGLHIESDSTMFGTVLNYVTLRILGCAADLASVARARAWILEHGGAQGTPSWGKFWLNVLNCMPWEGSNAIFPELWLLPTALPFHPSRFWCHCRMVYLPMAYVSGAKFTVPVTPLIESLRSELYPVPYAEVDFRATKNFVSPTDRYTDQTLMLKAANTFMNLYEDYFPKWLFRPRALKFILDYITAEDTQTNYVDIGPVSKFINMLACFHGYGRDSIQFRLHQSRINDYFWVAEDGMKVQGYNGSQLWDTAFAVQAYIEFEDGVAKRRHATGRPVEADRTARLAAGPSAEFLRKAYTFVESAQVVKEVEDREKWFRHVSLGGWPFSTRDHGWPISDCTAEGLKAAMLLHHSGLVSEQVVPTGKFVSEERQCQAVNVILTLQNYQDGGWATYENMRGPKWLEALNPSEVFGGIMVDYSYVECTSACVQVLSKFRHDFPAHRTAEVNKSIEDGVRFITKIQRPNGAWCGSWAICFTYGGWFGLEGLKSVGFTYRTSEAMRKGVAFLLSKQHKDGGWGESFKSCVTKEYHHSYDKNLVAAADAANDAEGLQPLSMVINTAWALLGLLAADYHKIDRAPIDAAARLILSRQLSNGDWPQEGISGVFNNNCMITYTAYRSIFPIWAIGRYLDKMSELST